MLRKTKCTYHERPSTRLVHGLGDVGAAFLTGLMGVRGLCNARYTEVFRFQKLVDDDQLSCA